MSSLIVEVCQIKDVIHHPNADKLDIASVKGWNCIVGRDSYRKGDLCVFFPPDSVLPEKLINDYELEFLKKGGRVGTLKLRGFISQGLVLPVTCVPRTVLTGVGDNVADVLGVTKYEVPERHVQGQSRNRTSANIQNPYFSKYTDIENIKNFDTVFADGDLVVITEKIHGSNIRFGKLPIEINWKSKDILSIVRSLWNKYILRRTHEFVYGSHNVQLLWNNQKNYYIKNIWSEVLKSVNVDALPENFIFYGEVFGKGVQDMEYSQDGLSLAIFDVKDISGGEYLDWGTVKSFCQMYGLFEAPELYIGPYHSSMLPALTSNKSKIDGGLREGCVVKSLLEENDRKIGRKILKSINPDYLTRKNGTEFH